MHLKESSNDGSTTDDTGNGWAGGGSKTSGGGGAGHGRGWARTGSGAGLSGAGAVVWHGGRASASSRDASWAAASWVWGRGSGHDHAAGDWEDGHLIGERLKENMLAAGKLQKIRNAAMGIPQTWPWQRWPRQGRKQQRNAFLCVVFCC